MPNNMPSTEISRNSGRNLPSQSHSRSRSRRQTTRRALEEYTLVIDHVPQNYRWQEVKDELRAHATHVSRVHDMEQPGLYSVVINSRAEAFSAYESLRRKGFNSGVPIRVVLTKDSQTIKGPEWGPRPPSAQPSIYTQSSGHPYLPQSTALVASPYGGLGPGHVIPSDIPSFLPLFPVPPQQTPHPVTQVGMDFLRASMQSVSMGQLSRHQDQPNEYQSTSPPVSANLASTRHTPTSSTDSNSSIAHSKTSSTTSSSNRHKRDGPLVVDGSVRRR